MNMVGIKWRFNIEVDVQKQFIYLNRKKPQIYNAIKYGTILETQLQMMTVR